MKVSNKACFGLSPRVPVMPVFMARGRVRFVLIKPTRPGRLEREGGGSGGRNSAIAMDARASSPRFARLIAFLLTLVIASCAAEEDPHLGTVRVVFQVIFSYDICFVLNAIFLPTWWELP